MEKVATTTEQPAANPYIYTHNFNAPKRSLLVLEGQNENGELVVRDMVKVSGLKQLARGKWQITYELLNDNDAVQLLREGETAKAVITLYDTVGDSRTTVTIKVVGTQETINASEFSNPVVEDGVLVSKISLWVSSSTVELDQTPLQGKYGLITFEKTGPVQYTGTYTLDNASAQVQELNDSSRVFEDGFSVRLTNDEHTLKLPALTISGSNEPSAAESQDAVVLNQNSLQLDATHRSTGSDGTDGTSSAREEAGSAGELSTQLSTASDHQCLASFLDQGLSSVAV